MVVGDTHTADQRKLLASRIRSARERLQISQQELAERAKLPAPQTVSSIENGDRDVKAVELVRIANALHTSVMDLLAGSQQEPRILWRKAPADEKLRLEAEARIWKRCREYQLAEQWAGIARPTSLPDYPAPRSLEDRTYAENVAAEVRRELDLGGYPGLSLTGVLEESAGIKILYERGFAGSAACSRDDTEAVIVVNSSEPPTRRNFSIAHDLFHVATWNSIPAEEIAKSKTKLKSVETLANRFAGALLVPEESLRRRLGSRLEGRSLRRIEPADLAELAGEFRVSVDALVWRLKDLGWINKQQADALIANKSFHVLSEEPPWEHEMPVPMEDRFLRLLLVAYAKGNVSAGRISEMTGRSLFEVRKMLSAMTDEAEVDSTTPPTA